MCGSIDLMFVTETVSLEGGVVVKNLSHYRCRACQTRLFDTHGIHAIQCNRGKVKPNARKVA